MTDKIISKVENFRAEIDRCLSHLDIPNYPDSLYEPMQYTLNARGKRIRPIFLLLVGEGLGAKHDLLIPAALAIEILHTFTLVHDDIMDNDIYRRGMLTVHKKWDTSTAILTGDSLMSLSFEIIMQTDSPNIAQIGSEFSRAMLEICEGQALDMKFEKNNNVSKEQYLDMVGRKTGKLLGLSCQLGAMIADANPDVVNEIFLFGKELGQAFQIQDDLLEIISNQKKMGKSLGSDIKSGKKTYPMIEAISGMNDREKISFMEFLHKNADSREVILTEFQKRNSIEKSKKLINSLFTKAKSHLNVLPDGARAELEEFVELISQRQS
jgi:geranylgeranyl diphosphate synthase type II